MGLQVQKAHAEGDTTNQVNVHMQLFAVPERKDFKARLHCSPLRAEK